MKEDLKQHFKSRLGRAYMQHHSVVRRHLSYSSCFPFVFLAFLSYSTAKSHDLSFFWSVLDITPPTLSLSHSISHALSFTHTHIHTHIHTHSLCPSDSHSLSNSFTHSLLLSLSLSHSLSRSHYHFPLSLYINLGPWSRFSNRWYKSSSKVLLESFWSKTTGRCDILYWNRFTWKWATEYWRSPTYRGQKSSQIR